MASTITFDILARDRASDKFDKVGDSAAKSSGKLKKFAAVGAAAAAAGALVLGKALVDMTKNAMADEAAQRKLAIGIKNATGATNAQVAGVEKWIAAQGKALGVTDDELRPAFQRLVQATGDVDEAQRQLGIAMDVSAGTGKSLKTVSEALMKANNGTTASLSKLGLKTKDANGETMSLDAALKSMSATFKGQAQSAASTTEGKFQRLKVMFDETKESIGARLIPIADKLAGLILRQLVPAVQKAGDWLRDKLGPPMRELAEKAGPAAAKVMAALKQAFQDAKPFIELVGKVLSNVVVPGLKKLLEVAGPVLGAALRTVGKMLGFIGDAGKTMWNTILQPVFRLLAKAVAVVLDTFSSLLDAMSNVPGFGWAEKAAASMGRAADKALAISNNIKKIPPSKTVNVTVAYRYEGLKSGTRGSPGEAPDLLRALPGAKRSAEKIGAAFMDTLAQAMKRGGKKVDEVLGDNLERIRDRLQSIKDEMASLSDSISSSLNQTDFSGGLTELMASLTGNNSALTGLAAVFDKLKGSVSQGFLSQLMQSGNVGLATQLGSDPAAAAAASATFDANASIAKGLGDQTAQAVLGDKIKKALEDELKKVRDELKELPDKQAKKLAREIKDLRLEVIGLRDAGARAHLRGAF